MVSRAPHTGVLLTLGVPITSGTFLWAGLALPLFVAGMVARYWPALRAFSQDRATAAAGAWFSRGTERAAWDAEFVRAYWRNEGQHRRSEEQQSHRRRTSDWSEHSQRQWERRGPGKTATAMGPDHKGYYKTLGVSPDASADEIQAAFRGLAFKHHPDRTTDERDKGAATKRFQAITAAYQVSPP
jgi:hypothetical protein